MTPINTLTYEGTPIRLRGAMLNLTDMWKAAGRPENRRPTDWLSLEETHRLRAHADTQPHEVLDPFEANADEVGIWNPDTGIDRDRFVATVRGQGGGTWAHWQLALSYGRYLSPPFHLWCNTVVRAAMERRDALPAPEGDRLMAHLTRLFEPLHRRFDILDRHAADLMFLQVSAQEVVLGQRRRFSLRSQALIIEAVAAEPYRGRCPCCTSTPVLTEEGRVVEGAEFDHYYHRGLNRPEHGWLVCGACHDELTYGGYVVQFERMPEFRRFQAAVLALRWRALKRSLPLPPS
ncbi:KilA-N domain-containing protein [Roseomonas nepalensis]|uniref:KilA-N domain-containing protein n=1 Tax=Muricoccus nepalensis TaxID=1854500 RepID=A0A502EQJ0_9PROT|nr:KilA-N domain-containing protein [Roseomonas nepalensis]TPG39199.1 KilA-N domain-containing protein [Roseomonas nepalensis]